MKRLSCLFFSLAASFAVAQPTMPTSMGFDTRAVGIDQKLGASVPGDLRFTDENGKQVQLSDYFGKRPIIFHPVWYSCVENQGACSLTLHGLLQSFIGMKVDMPGKDFDVITFTIKPTETTDMAMKTKVMTMKTLNKPGAENGWHFLTGDLENISKLSAALGFRYTYNPTLDKINHASGIMVATKDGTISQYLYGQEYAANLLLRAIDQAGEGKVAARPAEPILLGCFEFDPNTGTHRLVWWRAVQVGGVATVIILITSIAVMSLKNKTPRPPRASGTLKQ